MALSLQGYISSRLGDAAEDSGAKVMKRYRLMAYDTSCFEAEFVSGSEMPLKSGAKSYEEIWIEGCSREYYQEI
jgi:hypothetical protein